VIREVIPPDELSTIVANLGLASGFSSIYSSNAAPDSGFVMVSLKARHRVHTSEYVRRVRSAISAKVPELETFFSSGSIIEAVLNFGLAAPIDIQLNGPDFPPLYDTALKIKAMVLHMPLVSEAFIPEEAGYPTINIKVDRVTAARLGLSQKDVVSNVITALTSNAVIAPSIWIDPVTGDDYFLTAQYTEQDIHSLDTLRDIPVRSSTDETSRTDALLLRSVATLEHQAHPAEADHYNIQRVVDVLVSPSTQDAGGTQSAIQKVVSKVPLPPNVSVVYRGSVSAMEASFASFGFGLMMAVALLYLVMVAQFRSFLDPFIIMFAVPMGLIGVVWMLLATNTTLNIESFMGIIVMVGIVVSNSILLVDFANQRVAAGAPLREAVVSAARTRMRPILMTALATLAGLAPIAMVLEAGSETSAPLARAALGGLAVSTVLTLVLVPTLYELFHSRREAGK
jgi:multidrug efflux pump subunit AcrB